MIIEFSVANFRSIKEMQTISFVASPIVSQNKEIDKNNLIEIDKNLSLLKTVAIYGANASGKSNVVRAMAVFFGFLARTIDNNELGRDIEPFTLDIIPDVDAPTPVYFQLVFMVDNIKFRYGFEYLRGSEDIEGEVISEWLFGTPQKNEVYYFKREKQQIEINKKQFAEGIDLVDKTKISNLFLNICNAFNGEISNEIKKLFNKYNAIGISFFGTKPINTVIQKKLIDNKYKKFVLDLLQFADIDIVDYGVRDDGKIYTSRVMLPITNMIRHRRFDFEKMESTGTKKIFNWAFVLYDILERNGILIIDEFDAQLHPLLTRKIVQLFNSKVNTGAQLVFVTHDTHLLDKDLLRRDQIYFTEKNKQGETQCYSLADFNNIRNDASYEKDYIKGKYGAIPFLGDFEALIQDIK